jgi:STE24 endopeptidase
MIELDPWTATRAFLETVPPEARARSDAYFEGGYWLQLWALLATVGISWLLLHFGLSRRMRDWAARVTRFRSGQIAVYWVQYSVLTTLLGFPMSLYADYLREKQYGFATHDFSGWMGDQLKALALGVVLGAIAVAILYRVFRAFPRTWWAWGAGVIAVFNVIALLAFPVFIAPLFNEYTPLENASIRDRILRIAHANGIEAHRVYEFNASRQTNKISANVSGFARSMRISLNDNLLKRCTPEEIEAVMAHEIGHYALNHVYENVVFTTIVTLLMFLAVRGGFESAVRRWGARWGVRDIADPAGLPLLVLLVAVANFALMPVTNTFIRTNEAEADVFGLNAARQPDGFATVALKLGEYRKLEPSAIEEALLFDHPSGRARILMAMTWKAHQD